MWNPENRNSLMIKALQNLFQAVSMVCPICSTHTVSISIRKLCASPDGEHMLVTRVSWVINSHEQSNVEFLFITVYIRNVESQYATIPPTSQYLRSQYLKNGFLHMPNLSQKLSSLKKKKKSKKKTKPNPPPKKDHSKKKRKTAICSVWIHLHSNWCWQWWYLARPTSKVWQVHAKTWTVSWLIFFS